MIYPDEMIFLFALLCGPAIVLIVTLQLIIFGLRGCFRRNVWRRSVLAMLVTAVATSVFSPIIVMVFPQSAPWGLLPETPYVPPFLPPAYGVAIVAGYFLTRWTLRSSVRKNNKVLNLRLFGADNHVELEKPHSDKYFHPREMNLKSTESKIEEEWIPGINGAVTCNESARIDWLIKNVLVFITRDESGWDTLYQDPTDGRFWELTYPRSEMHGGGPRLLHALENADAGKRYRFEV
jgi:hypothetical protein